MRDYQSETTRISRIVGFIEALQRTHPQGLVTHTYVQDAVSARDGISGTLVRKYIRRAIVTGRLDELRPSYDGSIGGLHVFIGEPVYIETVRDDVVYRLSSLPFNGEQPRQLALLATPNRLADVLRAFTVPDHHHDCG